MLTTILLLVGLVLAIALMAMTWKQIPPPDIPPPSLVWRPIKDPRPPTLKQTLALTPELCDMPTPKSWRLCEDKTWTAFEWGWIDDQTIYRVQGHEGYWQISNDTLMHPGELLVYCAGGKYDGQQCTVKRMTSDPHPSCALKWPRRKMRTPLGNKPSDRQAIDMIRDMRPGNTFSAIADALNERGLRRIDGGSWTSGTVRTQAISHSIHRPKLASSSYRLKGSRI